MLNDHPVGIMMSSSSMGTKNLTFPTNCKRFGAEGSLLKSSLKVLASIGMVTEVCLTMLVLGGFLFVSN